MESDLSKFFIEGQNLDEIELKFDKDGSLFVSKNFLALASPVFERMFRTPFKEMKTNCVEMKGKDRNLFEKVLLRLHPRSQKQILGKYWCQRCRSS